MRRARTVRTSWGSLSLVRATLQLFRQGLESPSVRVLCLLSESCIPLLSPDATLAWLDAETERGALSLLDAHTAPMRQASGEEASAPAPTAVPHGQFLVLTRDAVERILHQEEELLAPFSWERGFPRELCADEHFFGYALCRLALPWKARSVTHVDWRTQGAHPVMHSSARELAEELERIAALQLDPLFLRKVDLQLVSPLTSSRGSSASARTGIVGSLLGKEREACAQLSAAVSCAVADDRASGAIAGKDAAAEGEEARGERRPRHGSGGDHRAFLDVPLPQPPLLPVAL